MSRREKNQSSGKDSGLSLSPFLGSPSFSPRPPSSLRLSSSFSPHPPTSPRPSHLRRPKPRHTYQVVDVAALTAMKKLDEGMFGCVYSAELGGVRVAMKSSLRDDDTSVQHEIGILKTLSHPFLPRLIGVVVNASNAGFIMPYMNGGTFDSFIISNKQSEKAVTPLLFNVSDALVYLHNRGWVHRDIKPKNIMLNKAASGQRVAVLSDLGSAKRVGDVVSPEGTTPAYLDPALAQQYAIEGNEVKCTYSQDIYAFGLLMLAAVNQGRPHVKQLSLFQIACGKLPALVSPEGVSDKFLALVKSCTFFNTDEPNSVQERPKAEAIYERIKGMTS